MNKQQFFNKYRNLNIAQQELERKYRLMKEEENMRLLLESIRIASQQTSAGASGSGATPQPAATLFGMYINGFSSILGDNTAETNLRSFIEDKGMNDLTFYMGSILNDPAKETEMRSLVSALNADGQTRIFSNVTQAANCIIVDQGTEAYYNLYSAPNERFTGFTQEWEFWNSNNPYGDFTTFVIDDQQIYAYCVANDMTYDIYVSRCEDYTGSQSPENIADYLVQYHDTIHLVNYITEATYLSNAGLNTTRKTQLELIGNAAIANNKIQNVSILWAAEGNTGTNMRDWFVANPDLNAFDGFQAEYDAWPNLAKAGINLVGQKIYAYSGISDL
jgi:hypothetical protein